MKLAVIEDNGIGREVIPETVKVLGALGLENGKSTFERSYTRWKKQVQQFQVKIKKFNFLFSPQRHRSSPGNCKIDRG